MIITIDGPAASGKSTTARAVARRLDFRYVDTGAMYRAVALAFLRAEADTSPEGARRLLPDVRIDVSFQDDAMHVALNGEDVTHAIRRSEVGTMASDVSTLKPVREKMVRAQRRIAEEREEADGGVVFDGRDMGTVVFPEAELKIFMKAAPEERARRRQAEYAEQGQSMPLERVIREIKARDEKDRTREIAPLRRADDAVLLDTTDRSIEEQVEFVVQHARARRSRERT